jgi:preprotein translocase subunit SecG
MMSVILVIHLIVALGIIAVVLVQPAEAGGFLGSGGSMSNMMAPRRKGDVLTRMTHILAGIFFLTSLSLAIMAEHHGPAKSILDVPTDTAAPTAAAPATPVAPAAEKTAPPPDASALKTVAPAPAPAVHKKQKPAAPISK